MRLSTLGRVARNSTAVTAALLMRRGVNFLLYVLIARYLGVFSFGQFSLVYNLFLIFEVPAMFGLASLIVREVAKNKSEYGRYLINGHLLVLLASLGSMGIWILAVHLLGYSAEVVRGTYLLGVALIPFSMKNITESIFKAFERMQFIVYAFASANLVQLVLVWWLLSRGYGLLWIFGLVAGVQFIWLLLDWFFIYKYFPATSWRLDWGFCHQLARTASTFLGIGLFNVIFLRVNVVILSKFCGNREVGLYNAAFQLIFFFMLISRSLWEAVYPVLSRTFVNNRQRFRQYAERSSEFLISLAIPLAILFIFLAEAILLVYKSEFIEAAPVLRILGWLLVLMSFERIFGGVLLASGLQRSNLLIIIINTISLLIISMWLIQRFELMGAAWAMLISHVISFALHLLVVYRKVFPVNVLRVLWKPLAASLFMTALMIWLSQSSGLLVVVPASVVLYGAVLLGLHLIFGAHNGSVRQWLAAGRLPPDIQEPEV
jgi:O-antigen/teichoic acid export membrane protein